MVPPMGARDGGCGVRGAGQGGGVRSVRAARLKGRGGKEEGQVRTVLNDISGCYCAYDDLYCTVGLLRSSRSARSTC
jgi:hypothetical protein